jgi:hypothetical protein
MSRPFSSEASLLAAGGLRRGGGGCGALRGPARRQERRQIDEANTAGQARQDVREVLARIDARETSDPAQVRKVDPDPAANSSYDIIINRERDECISGVRGPTCSCSGPLTGCGETASTL